MASILDRKLLVVSGKGGTGKTTIAGALGLLAARAGRRTIVLDMSGSGGALEELLASTELLTLAQIDQDRALLEWLQALGGRIPGRMLASRSGFQYFAAAAPGAREFVSLVKIWNLIYGSPPSGATSRPPSGTQGAHDLVVLDAPATGHALGLLSSPQTFARVARSGPIARQATELRELLEDQHRTAYIGVAQCTEMSILETLQLQEQLGVRLGRELEAVVLNGMLPRRFNASELKRIEALESEDPLVHAAAQAARSAYARSSSQQAQLARLRRRGLSVLRVPFIFTPQLDLGAMWSIADRLEQAFLAPTGARRRTKDGGPGSK